MQNLFFTFLAIFFQSIPAFTQNESENCDSLGSELNTLSEEYIDVVNNNSETFFYIFLIVVIYYASCNWLFPHFFKSLHQSLFNDRIQSKFFKNQLNTQSLAIYLVKIFNLIVQSITVYLLYNYFSDNTFETEIVFLLSLILFFIGYQIVKELINAILVFVFNNRNLIKVHTFNAMISKTFLSYFLLVISLCFALTNAQNQYYLFVLMVVLVVISFIIEYSKALYSLMNNTIFNKFQFFIYLCILEILPLVIFYKLFTNWM